VPIIGGGSGGGGGNTTAQVVASGKVLPVADATGVTVDTTTYDNTITSVGKFTTLVFPVDDGVFAVAVTGDVFPRWVQAVEELYFGSGTADPVSDGCAIYASGNNLNLSPRGAGVIVMHGPAVADAAASASELPRLSQVSPLFTIASGALPTVQLVTATGAQILTTRDAETVTPVTFNSGAANTATCLVAISPDNVTYSALGTETEPVGVALAGTIHLVKVRVPAGWYLKLTVTNATLGVTTYY
jgi:hypothetical protein